MELKKFEGLNRDELSLIEVAYALLEQKGEIMNFTDLLVEVQSYLELSDTQLEERMTRLYTDLNIDGSFISLGDNRWGLREWYPIDSIDEEITSSIDDEDTTKKRRKKRKKVNAFGDEDIIDYNDDDPEDDDSIDLDEDSDDEDEEVVDIVRENDEEDVQSELEAYRSDLSELGADEDLIDEVSADEDLVIVGDEELDEDLDEEI